MSSYHMLVLQKAAINVLFFYYFRASQPKEVSIFCSIFKRNCSAPDHRTNFSWHSTDKSTRIRFPAQRITTLTRWAGLIVSMIHGIMRAGGRPNSMSGVLYLGLPKPVGFTTMRGQTKCDPTFYLSTFRHRRDGLCLLSPAQWIGMAKFLCQNFLTFFSCHCLSVPCHCTSVEHHFMLNCFILNYAFHSFTYTGSWSVDPAVYPKTKWPLRVVQWGGCYPVTNILRRCAFDVYNTWRVSLLPPALGVGSGNNISINLHFTFLYCRLPLGFATVCTSHSVANYWLNCIYCCMLRVPVNHIYLL